MNILKWLITLACLFALVIFGARNMDPVRVDFIIFGETYMPMFILMAILVFAGAAIAALISVIDQLRLRSRIRGQNRKIKELESELSSLRHLPLTEAGQGIGEGEESLE